MQNHSPPTDNMKTGMPFGLWDRPNNIGILNFWLLFRYWHTY